MSSDTVIKGLPHNTETQFFYSCGLDTKILVLCVIGCSNLWVAGNCADRLSLHGNALKLTVRSKNAKRTVDSRILELIVKPGEHQDFESFTVVRFVKKGMNVGSDITNVQALQKISSHLALIDPVRYCCKDLEMILGQDVFYAIHPLEYFSVDG